MEQGEMIRLVGLVAVLLLFIIPGFIYYSRGWTRTGLLRNIVLWLGLFVVAALLFQLFH